MTRCEIVYSPCLGVGRLIGGARPVSACPVHRRRPKSVVSLLGAQLALIENRQIGGAAMTERQAWIEVIVGGVRLDEAKKRAALAAAAGADRIGIATPLIYSEGYRVISEVKTLASTIPVLADLK